ncbi:MAG: hypothetical protein RLZZ522_2053 [Verrucomicrobiota bacterium]
MSRPSTMSRYFIRLLACAACLTLLSCIDGHEEYWLEADGSGRAAIHYEVPAAFAASLGGTQGIEEILDRFIRETPTLTHATRQVTRTGDRLTVELNASFNSVLDLIAAVSGDSALTAGAAGSALDPLIGKFDVRQQGLTVDFSRTVFPAKALPGSSFMPAAQLDGRHLVYILHLPVPAQETNATHTEADGRTLIWDQPFKGGAVKQLPLRFKAKLPLPWRLIAGSAAGLAALLGLAVLVFRRLRRPQPQRS